MARLVPEGDCHGNLMRALMVVEESRRRVMARNVGVRVQARWIAHYEVERALDVRRGWVRRAGAGVVRVLTKGEVADLEREVLEELSLA